MKKLILYVVTSIAFAISANARSLNAAIEDIPTLVKYLTTKGETVTNQYGRTIKTGDDLTGWNLNWVGFMGTGHGYGNMDGFARLVNIQNKGEILVNRGNSSIYLYSALTGVSDNLSSKLIDAAIKSTIKKIARRVEKAAEQTRLNHPMMPQLEVRNDDAFMMFYKMEGGKMTNVARKTKGIVHELDTKDMDPAVLQEFLETIIKNVEQMKEL